MGASDGSWTSSAQLEGLVPSVLTLVGDSHGGLGWCFALRQPQRPGLASCVSLNPVLVLSYKQDQRGEKAARSQSWEALGKLHCVSMNTCVMKISGSAVAELTFVLFSGEICWNSLQRRLLVTTVTSAVWLILVARTLHLPPPPLSPALFFLVLAI